MNRFRNFIALTSAIIALAVVSVPARSIKDDTKQAGKTIEQQIDHELRMLNHYGIFDHITYQVNGSTVTLDGKVYTLSTKRDAAAAIKRIPGVTSVVNNIDELPPSSFDDQIRRQALRTFESRGLGRYLWETNPDVRIIVENGHITLEGYVANSGDFNAMNIFANGITNVFSVTNNLKIGKPEKS
ncbi:MAG: BON domain-containing protein [Acidobacteriota bacterium]